MRNLEIYGGENVTMKVVRKRKRIIDPERLPSATVRNMNNLKSEVRTLMGAFLKGSNNGLLSGRFLERARLTPLGLMTLMVVFTVSVLIGFSGKAGAATATTAGSVTARATDATSIEVVMTYTGDDTTPNNTYRVQWKLCSDGSYPVPPANTIDGAHTASPYRTTIPGLTANTCYNIQATYNDADGVNGANPQTLKLFSTWDNTLLHNSNRFFSPQTTKWGGDWGTPTGQYGQIVCETCHVKSTTNIKRVKAAITAPSGSFPGQPGSVNFQSKTSPDGFGDDNDPTGHATSTKVCEFCHSLNKYHNYNTANNTNGLTHNNNADCTTCHAHRTGFVGSGDCATCHGNPPEFAVYGGGASKGMVGSGLGSGDTGITSPLSPGAHIKHVTTRGMLCATCHKGSTMPSTDNKIQMGFEVNATNFPGWGPTAVTIGTMDLRTPDAPFTYEAYLPDTTVNSVASYSNTCSSLYCHGSTLTSGSKTNPSWVGGGTEATCGTCHGGSAYNAAANPAPTHGSHTKHASSAAGNLALSCDLCHFSTTDMSHINGSVAWSLNSSEPLGRITASSKYNGALAGATNALAPTAPASYGTCQSIYCHSDVQGASGSGAPLNYYTPQWGNNTLNCGSCHKNMASDAVGTGSHLKHANTYAIACSICHSGAGAGTLHANYAIDMVFSGMASTTTYSQSPNTPGNGWGTCSTSYCHSNVQGAGGSGGPSQYQSPAPTWGGSVNCGSCHVDMSASASATASHIQHAQAPLSYACSVCHGAGYTSSAVVTSSHVNNTINMALTGVGAGAAYSEGNNAPGSGYGTCATSNCHGTASPTWGTGNSANATCTKCHGVRPTTPAEFSADNKRATPGYKTGGLTGTDTSGSNGEPQVGLVSADQQVGAHDVHLRASNSYSNPIACSECHNNVNFGGITFTNHMDGSASLDWGDLSKHNSGVYSGGQNLTPGYAGGSCTSTYCHGGGTFPADGSPSTKTTPSWTGGGLLAGAGGADCGKCHGNPPNTGGHGGVSANVCSSCHAHVNDSATAPPFFNNLSLHINGVRDGGGDACSDCHSSAGGPTAGTTPDAFHAKHVQTAYVGSVAAGDYGNYTTNNWYAYSNTGGVPNMKCGYCHPQSSATHNNTFKNINLNPSDTGAAGTLKARNDAAAAPSGSGTTTVCNKIYCHSNGTTAGLATATTPQWGGSFTGDKCGACHGNSPTGTAAHAVHVVSIHYNGIYNGSNGLIASNGTTGSGAGHGDTGVSTTINCNLCHNSTVTMSRNRDNTVCVTCHSGDAAGTVMVIDAASTTHVDGTVNVAFANVTMKSRAQMRNDITQLEELNENWTRQNSYKAGATSHDLANKLLNAGFYTSATKTCSNIACHNQDAAQTRSVQWTDTGNASYCFKCHKRVPL